MTQGFNAPGVVKPFGIFSSAAWQSEGRVLKISGHVSQDAEGRNVGQGNIKAQTRQVLENILGVLACVGCTMDDVGKVTVFVTNLAEIKKIHAVRSEYFSQPYPASTLVQVAKLIDPEWLIEIEADAVVPEDRIIEPLTV